MAEQSYRSFFTLTIGVLVQSQLKDFFVILIISLLKNEYRQLVLSKDHFSNYLKQLDEKTAFLKFI